MSIVVPSPYRKCAAEFEESANQFNELRRAYETKRDALANDALLAAIIEDGTKKRNSVIKSVKKIVQGKAAKKSWSPHVEHYKSNPKKEFGDAMDTLTKANKDLTRIEQQLHSTKEDHKLLVAVIQEYTDLLHIANAVVEQTSALIAPRQSEWTKYVAAVEYVPSISVAAIVAHPELERMTHSLCYSPFFPQSGTCREEGIEGKPNTIV